MSAKRQFVAILGACALSGSCAVAAMAHTHSARATSKCSGPVIRSFTSHASPVGFGGWVFNFTLVVDYTFADTTDDIRPVFYGNGGDAIFEYYASRYAPSGTENIHRVITVRFRSQPMDWDPSYRHIERVLITTGALDCGTAEDSVEMSLPSSKPASPPPAVTGGCPDYAVLDSRGSELHPKLALSPPGAAFLQALRNAVKPARVASWMNPYPAVGGAWGMISGKLKLPVGYKASVAEGEANLGNKIAWYAKNCSQTVLYLVGYSQGAEVTGNAYQNRYWPNVAAVVLFGDPLYNRADAQADRYHLPYDGVRGARKPFAGLEAGKVMSFCHKRDPFCQGLPLLYLKYRSTDHTNYGSLGEPEKAVRYIMSHN